MDMNEPRQSPETQPPTSMSAAPKQRRSSRRTIARWLRRGLLAAVGLAVVSGIVLAWMPKPLEVDMATATRGSLRVTIDEDGQSRVIDRYVVSAPLVGSLARIELKPGDNVTQGQLLARIVPLLPPLLDERSRTGAEARVAAAVAAQRQASAQIERAAANKSFAEREAERQSQLVKSGTISQAELDQALLVQRTSGAELESARFAARVADYELEMAKATLRRISAAKAESRGEQLDVSSPVSGRVLKVLHESEGVVQPGTPLIEVGDPRALEIAVDVLTVDAVRIPANARVTIDRWGGEALEGRVRRTEPSAFTRLSSLGVEEQRVNVLIDLTSPREKWQTLGDGYRVEAHIVVWEGSDVVKVPASSVFRHRQGWAAYRVDGDRVRLTPAELGERTGREVQILTGIQPGTRVVLYPSDQLGEGALVKSR